LSADFLLLMLIAVVLLASILKVTGKFETNLKPLQLL